MRELKEQLKDTSVVVEMDNSRELDMKQVVKEVKSQFEEVSARSRKEAEAWYKNKVTTPCLYIYTYICHWSGPLKGTSLPVYENTKCQA